MDCTDASVVLVFSPLPLSLPLGLSGPRQCHPKAPRMGEAGKEERWTKLYDVVIRRTGANQFTELMSRFPVGSCLACSARKEEMRGRKGVSLFFENFVPTPSP